MDREARDFVKEQWSTGNKNAIADLFSHVNFQEDIWLHVMATYFSKIDIGVLEIRLKIIMFHQKNPKDGLP